MIDLDTQQELNFEKLKIRNAEFVVKAIIHPLRNQIIQLLHKNGNMTVTKIYNQLRIGQSVASQHLAILRKAGIVCDVRDTRFVWYSLNYEKIRHIHKLADGILQTA